MDPTPPPNARLANPACRLIADRHRQEKIPTRGSYALSDGKADGSEDGTTVRHIADVAVIRRGRVAENRVDPSDLMGR